MTETILFVGDTHMNADEILRINEIAHTEKVDKVIQVGDFGYTFSEEFLHNIALCKVPWLFIRGNHDSTEWIKQAAGVENMYSGPVCEVAPNLSWIPDGTVLKLGDSFIAFVGGAASIDKVYRTEYVSWWPDEEPSQAALYRLAEEAEGKEIFALVTHDLPEFLVVEQFNNNKLDHKPSLNVRRLLDEAFLITKPRIVIHGHWHYSYTATIHDTDVFGLDCDTKPDNYVIMEL